MTAKSCMFFIPHLTQFTTERFTLPKVKNKYYIENSDLSMKWWNSLSIHTAHQSTNVLTIHYDQNQEEF